MGFIMIILTTSASLRAIDPLFSYSTVELVITFKDSVFCYKLTLLLEVIFCFQTSIRSNNTSDAEHGPGY